MTPDHLESSKGLSKSLLDIMIKFKSSTKTMAQNAAANNVNFAVQC